MVVLYSYIRETGARRIRREEQGSSWHGWEMKRREENNSDNCCSPLKMIVNKIASLHLAQDGIKGKKKN